MAKSRQQLKKTRHKNKLSINLQIPTVPVVLIVFALVGFYVANDNLLIILINWGFLTSALIYLNTFWLGSKEILEQQIDANKIKDDSLVLMMNGNDELPISRSVTKLKQMAMVTVTNQSSDLPYENAAYDVVIINHMLQDIRPHIKRVQALQEAARLVKKDGRIIIIERGFNANQYQKFLSQAGFKQLMASNCGPLGWWSGPWCPTNVISAIK